MSLVHLARVKKGYASRIERVGTGDLLCDVETEDFQRMCRVQVFPGQWNTWLLYRTLRDDPNLDEIELTAKAVIARALGAKGPAALGGLGFHHVEVIVGEPTAGGAVPESIPDPFGPRQRVQSLRESCPGVPASLTPGAYIPVMVRFVYKGAPIDRPWLARKVLPGGVAIWCPTKADWLLDSVYLPLPEEPVPDEPTIPIPGIPDIDIDIPEDWDLDWEIVPQIVKETKSLLGYVIAGLGLLAVIALTT